MTTLTQRPDFCNHHLHGFSKLPSSSKPALIWQIHWGLKVVLAVAQLQGVARGFAQESSLIYGRACLVPGQVQKQWRLLQSRKWLPIIPTMTRAHIRYLQRPWCGKTGKNQAIKGQRSSSLKLCWLKAGIIWVIWFRTPYLKCLWSTRIAHIHSR